MNHSLRFSVFVFAFLVTALSACDQKSSLPDLHGHYYGTKTSPSGKRVFVSANVPMFERSNGVSTLDVKIFSALASSDVTEFFVQSDAQGGLSARTDLVPRGQFALRSDATGCASGTQGLVTFKLCLNAQKLTLDVADSTGKTSWEFLRDSSAPQDDGRAEKIYSLDEIVGRAKFLNYAVSQEAEQVFQAREAIQAARANLLPRLNVKEIVGIASADYVGAVGSLLPFIFPTNWFHLEQSKDLASAEEKSYAALRGDEMSLAQSLYYVVLRDQAVAAALDTQLKWMTETQGFLATEEKAGALPTGSAEYFGTMIAQLAQDRASLEALISSEYAELAHAVALPTVNGISALVQVDASTISTAKPLAAMDYAQAVVERAFELASVDALISAAKVGVQDASFSFLDPTNLISIGFDLGARVAISQSSEQELEKKKSEIQSLLQERIVDVVAEYNGALSNYSTAQAALTAVNDRVKWLVQRHLQGDPTLGDQEFVDSLADLQVKAVALTSNREFAVELYLGAQAKLDRLMLSGFYRNLDGSSSTEQGEK